MTDRVGHRSVDPNDRLEIARCDPSPASDAVVRTVEWLPLDNVAKRRVPVVKRQTAAYRCIDNLRNCANSLLSVANCASDFRCPVALRIARELQREDVVGVETCSNLSDSGYDSCAAVGMDSLFTLLVP